MRRAELLVGLLTVALVGASLACAPRVTPYRFAGSVGGLLPATWRSGAPPPERAREKTGAARDDDRGERLASSRIPPSRGGVSTAPTRFERPTFAPAPLRDPSCAQPSCLVVPASGIKAHVGEKTEKVPHLFVLEGAAYLGSHVTPAMRAVPTSNGLLELLEKQGAVRRDIEPIAGDLVFFTAGELVGVVTGHATPGVTEFVFVAGNRVRRGWVAPAQPALRDGDGRVLNTFIRGWGAADAKDTAYRADQAFIGFARLARRTD